MAAPHLGEWQRAGIRDLRLEFVHETPQQVTGVIEAHRAFLAGALSAAGLQDTLDALSARAGVTEGSLFVPHDFGTLDALPVL